MIGDKHVGALTEYSCYTNSEGFFGDDTPMVMIEDGSKYQIPTYQFWHQEGEAVTMHR